MSTDTALGQYVGRLQRKYSQRLRKEALKSSTSARRGATGEGGVGGSGSGGGASAGDRLTTSDGWASGGGCGQMAGAGGADTAWQSISREEESDLGSGSPEDELDGEHLWDSIETDGGAKLYL